MSKHIKLHENHLFEDDLREINKLIKQMNPLLGPTDWKTLKNVIEKGTIFILRDHNPEILKDFPNGKVIGKTVLTRVYKVTAFFGTIEDVVVDEAYRGKGLGKMLTKSAIKKAKKLGMKYVDLTSNPTRGVAHKLYESVGFKKRDTNPYRLHL